jgi:hypothetical protein
VGCVRMRSSSKPFAVAAIALGRYRGCGRNPLARICAQREPSFSPLGTAMNTVAPKGLLMPCTDPRPGIRRPFVVVNCLAGK